MSEKYLLRLDTKSVMRKSVKVVKAKRHKLQWCACARPREERGWKHFLRGLSCFLATLSRGEVILAKYCSGRLHSACSIVRGFGINLRCSEKKLPRFLKNLHRFRENLPRFWENLPRFFQSSPTYWTTLLLKEREKSWISGVSDSMCWSEEAFYDWPLQY